MLINNLTDGYVMNYSTITSLVTFSSTDSTGLVIYIYIFLPNQVHSVKAFLSGCNK